MRAPLSTYRLQCHAGFTFADAAAQVPYLAALGVSHLYLSPVLQAAPGSMHGYDVVDHSRVSDDLGGVEGLRALAATAREHGLGLISDVVPNHVSVTPPQDLNPAWWGLLRDGPDGPFGHWFDVAWEAEEGRVMVPVLGSPLEEVRAEITLDTGGPDPVLRYHDHVFPVRPGSEALPLAELLDAQHYRLAHWREAATGLNYRRFFDVTDLAGIRVEDPDVFERSHRVLLDLLADGTLDGLRIDHPDGLADPGGYLTMLADASDDAWVVVEKIVEGDEELPEGWRTAGTTGYETLNLLNGLLVDPAGEAPLTALYAELTGAEPDPATVIDTAKRLVVDTVLAAEVSRLAREAGFDAEEREALAELLAAMEVYRAYVRPGEAVPADQARHLDHAEEAAARRRPDLAAALARVRETVTTGPAGVVTRFQQTCGPVMAKGVEDTAFYRYHRLDGLNEVGADLRRFGVPVADVHAAAARQQERHPLGMTTLSTHDTKRSEDVRARLAVLSELPQEWATTVRALEAATTGHRVEEDTPGANDRYLAWQTLVGTWPISADRAVGYALKAAREAKQRTAWVDGDPDYDAALEAWLRAVVADPEVVRVVEGFVARIAPAATANSVAQKLLQLTWPGVPDVYQGTEVVELSLVDPDNRRPVDYDDRARRLREGADPKLAVVAAALQARRDHPDAFRGAYAPLAAQGPAAGHVVAFTRGERPTALTVATRLPVALAALDVGGTTLDLPAGTWRDTVTGAAHQGGTGLADLLGGRAATLLLRTEDGS